jgi:hypothetical protein
VDEGKLVFSSVLFAQVSPITASMPRKEVAGLFGRVLEGREGSGRGDDLTEMKWVRHLASQKVDTSKSAATLNLMHRRSSGTRTITSMRTGGRFIALGTRTVSDSKPPWRGGTLLGA